MKNLFNLILGSLCLFACEKVIDSDRLLDTGEKVYILGFISPQDTVLRVSVKKAFSVFGPPANATEDGTNAYLITDAQVTLEDSFGNQVSLNYDQELKTYTTDSDNFAIIGGGAYTLRVSVGNNSYVATCQVPEKIPFIEHEAFLEISGERIRNGAINIRFLDFPAENNFYMLGINYGDNGNEQLNTFGSDSNLTIYSPGQFLTDVLTENDFIRARAEISLSGNQNVKNTTLTIQVANLEEILFQELRSSVLNQFADGDPFIEYSITGNNIIGEKGIGIFAGYQLTEKEIAIIEE